MKNFIRVQVPNGGNSFFSAVAVCLHHHSTNEVLPADGAKGRGETLRAQLLDFASANVHDELVKFVLKAAYEDDLLCIVNRERSAKRVSYEELYEPYFEVLRDAHADWFGGQASIELFSYMAGVRVNVVYPRSDGTYGMHAVDNCSVVSPPDMYVFYSHRMDVDALLPSTTGNHVYHIT
jgi:hypothetical protein